LGNGGNLTLSSGAGTPSNLSGSIIFQYGLVTHGVFNVSSGITYLEIGLIPAQSGVLRVPNNLSALSARNNANDGDIYIIGTDTADHIIIGDASSTTIVSGNLNVLGTTTTIYSTIVDISDRVVHFNYTEGIVPVPTLISGFSVDRGSSDGYINRDAASLVWNESDGYWYFSYINQGDDLTISSILPIISESVSIKSLSSDLVALSGGLRVKNNVIGAAARNATNTADITVWQTDATDILKLGTTSNDTNIDGYNVRINTNLTGDILFDTNDQAEHIYLDGLQKLYINLMGTNPYLKAELGAYIDLPGGSSTSTNNFAIDGYHVDGYVTAANLSTLCNGSSADTLHTHAGLNNHNLLGGLQGGSGVDGYYHFTNQEHTWLQDGYTDGYWDVNKGGTGITSFVTGDIIYADSADNLNNLSIGDDGYILTVDSGLPVWKASTAISSSTIPISCGAYTALTGNYDGYLSPDFTLDSNELPVFLVNSSGTLQHLRISMTTAPGLGESVTFTVRVGTVDTGITVTVTGSNKTGADIVNSIAVTAGDLITIRVVTSAAGVPENIIASLNIVS